LLLAEGRFSGEENCRETGSNQKKRERRKGTQSAGEFIGRPAGGLWVELPATGTMRMRALASKVPKLPIIFHSSNGDGELFGSVGFCRVAMADEFRVLIEGRMTTRGPTRTFPSALVHPRDLLSAAAPPTPPYSPDRQGGSFGPKAHGL